MLARFLRIRHPWLVAVVVVICAFFVIEAGQLLAAQLSVDRAAQEAVRYAATGQFNSAHCTDNNQCDSSEALFKEQRYALEDAARLATINDIVRAVLGQEAATTARIVVCSDRRDETGHPQYTYLEKPTLSSPIVRPRCVLTSDGVTEVNDPGGPADKVMVDVTTDYPIIAFGGLGVGSISLHSYRELIIERYRKVRIQ